MKSLNFEWLGKSKFACNYFALVVNGKEVDRWRGDSYEITVPFEGNELEIEVLIGSEDKLRRCIRKKFSSVKNGDYTCELKLSSIFGWGLKMAEPGKSASTAYKNGPVAIWGFMWTIIGLFFGLTHRYNRTAGLISALSGFGLALLLTSELGVKHAMSTENIIFDVVGGGFRAIQTVIMSLMM